MKGLHGKVALVTNYVGRPDGANTTPSFETTWSSE